MNWAHPDSVQPPLRFAKQFKQYPMEGEFIKYAFGGSNRFLAQQDPYVPRGQNPGILGCLRQTFGGFLW